MILSDLVRGVPNPWAEIYDATRIEPAKGAGSFLRENLDVATEWIGDRLTSGEKRSAEGLRAGAGAVISGAAGKVAAYRYEAGVLHTVSAPCTHLGCSVTWNGLTKPGEN